MRQNEKNNLSKNDLLPIFFGLSACSWMPHWACHYYRLETGTSFVVGSWSFSPADSFLSMGIYGSIIVANLLCITRVQWRSTVALISGIVHLAIGSIHVVRLWKPFTFEVFGYAWTYGASVREVVIVMSFGLLCLYVARSTRRSTVPT